MANQPRAHGTNLSGAYLHPLYDTNRRLYEIDATFKYNASVEFEMTQEQNTFSFDVDARRSPGYEAFLDIVINTYKWAPGDVNPVLEVTIGRTLQEDTPGNHISITCRNQEPVPAHMEVRVSCDNRERAMANRSS